MIEATEATTTREVRCVHVVRYIPRKAKRAFQRLLRRRSAIEPSIGHMKSDHRLDRNQLTGKEGDRINSVLAAAGYNFRKLLRALFFVLFQWLVARFQPTPATVIPFRTPERSSSEFSLV